MRFLWYTLVISSLGLALLFFRRLEEPECHRMDIVERLNKLPPVIRIEF